MSRRPYSHFFSWAPADWLSSRVRTRSITTKDPLLRLAYLELLNVLQAAQGKLPNDAVFLADALGLEKSEVERILPILIELGTFGRGGIVVVGDEIQNRRVSEELQEKEDFRKTQAAHGAKGAQVRSGAKDGSPNPDHARRRLIS